MTNSIEKTFTLNLSYLKELKEFVTCEKCKNLLHNPVEISPCKHTFCSACLLMNVCPNCKLKYFDRDLKEPDVYTIRILNLIHKLDPLLSSTDYKIGGIPVDIFKTNLNDNHGDKSDDDESICNKIKWDREGEYMCWDIGNSRPIKRVGFSMKRNPKGETPLHIACKKGDYLKVLELIGKGVDLNVTDWANWTPLHEAVLSQSVNCVQILLSKGAMVNVCGEHYTTPLHQALSLESDEIVKLLLKYGADTNSADYTGLTAMDMKTTSSISDILKTTEKLETLPTQFLYYEPHSTIFIHDIKDQMPTKLYKDKYTFTKNSQAKDIFLCVIGNSVDLSQVEVLKCVADGIMIIREIDLSNYLNSKLPYVPKLIPEKIRPGLLKSIKFHLEKRPKLFDGMNFHVSDHQKPVTIGESQYTKSQLETLIKRAGGNILVRAPAESTSADWDYRPYHSKNCAVLKKCCNFIVYSHKEPPILLYRMVELRHVSSEWVVQCVMDYKIAFQ